MTFSHGCKRTRNAFCKKMFRILYDISLNHSLSWYAFIFGKQAVFMLIDLKFITYVYGYRILFDYEDRMQFWKILFYRLIWLTCYSFKRNAIMHFSNKIPSTKNYCNELDYYNFTNLILKTMVLYQSDELFLKMYLILNYKLSTDKFLSSVYFLKGKLSI